MVLCFRKANILRQMLSSFKIFSSLKLVELPLLSLLSGFSSIS
jgi:hypothetical protein